MFYAVLIIHIVLSISLILLVLIQQGKGADMGAAFGAGSSNSLFGAAGAANLLTRATTGIAIAFMFTSILLVNFFSAHRQAAGAPPAAAPVQNSAPAESAAAGSSEAATTTQAESIPAAAPAAAAAEKPAAVPPKEVPPK